MWTFPLLIDILQKIDNFHNMDFLIYRDQTGDNLEW